MRQLFKRASSLLLGIVGEGDVASFTGDVAIAIAITIGRRVAVAIRSLVAPESFLDDGLGSSRKGKVVCQSSTDKFGRKLPTFLGMLPILIDFLGESIGIDGVVNKKI